MELFGRALRGHLAHLIGFFIVISAAVAIGDDPPDVAIFVAAADDQIGKEFADILGEGETALTARVYPSLEEAAKSPAVVVLLAMARSGKPFSHELVEAVKGKKVIGVGYGAAQLFGKLELEINGGACAHFGSRVPKLRLPQSRLLGNQFASQEIAPYAKQTPADNFGMYLPSNDDRTQVVDVLARYGSDVNYAPIVKQNNFVMVGLSAQPQAWSADYRRLFHELAVALRSEQKQPFAKAKFTITRPGAYGLVVGQGRSTTQLPGKTYYFKFSKPTVFTAKLDHKGSDNMMMLFMGKKNRLHWTRKDAKHGETLTITIKITADDLKVIGDNYWTLNVTNFDRQNLGNCLLDIQYDK
jgi:hypothetical protein